MKKKDNIFGNLSIQSIQDSVFLEGDIVCSQEDYKRFLEDIQEKYTGKIIFNNLRHNALTVVEHDYSTSNKPEQDERLLDEIEVLYCGLIHTNLIKKNDKFKKVNATGKLKIDNVIKVFGVFAPLILDREMNIIDGQTRLELAQENVYQKVPVIIYNCSGKQADTLRLLINRASEFPKWKYDEIDPFIDDNPLIQPLAEPLGFFGKYVLPESFFSDTVINYVIDPFSKLQAGYRQEEGLAEWAKYRREQIEKQLKEKYASKRLKKYDSNTVSLFSLEPTQEDLTEREDTSAKAQEIVDKWTEKASSITEINDKKQRARKEVLGEEWQLKLRTSQEVVQEKREKFRKNILNTKALTEEQKSVVLADLDKFAHCKTMKDIKEELEKREN